MNKRKIKKVIIAVTVIGAAVGYLLYETVESSLAYCYPVDEFVEAAFGRVQQNSDVEASGFYSNRIVRLVGRVKNGSVVSAVDKMHFDFELAGKKASVPVRFYGPVPKNFSADKEIFVEGRLGSDGVFKADRILTRCESKYKVRLK